MDYNVTRYENYGQGYKKILNYNCCDMEAKITVKMLKERGFKRIKGSGIIGLSFEGKESFGKVQITIERLVD